MTSGQGGSEQEPTGQPGQQGQDGGQGWTPPPAPSYPSAPQAAPPSYPAAPGHGGTSWGGPAPRPVERPVTVRAGIGAFMASLILGLIASITRFTDIDSLVDQALAQTVQAGQEALTRDVARALVIIVAVISLVFVGLEAMFIWFAWNGRNWARIVLWVIGGFGVLSLFFVLGGGATTSSTGFLDALGVIQSLLVLAGVVLLALAPSNEWYRYRRWLRDTGQAR